MWDSNERNFIPGHESMHTTSERLYVWIHTKFISDGWRKYHPDQQERYQKEVRLQNVFEMLPFAFVLNPNFHSNNETYI